MQETKKRSLNTIIAAASSKENIIPESNSRSKLSLRGQQYSATAKPQWRVSGLQLPYFIPQRRGSLEVSPRG